MKFVVYNLGCKVNKYECDSIVKALRDKNQEVSEDLEFADVYILNTCAVTNEAERKSRQCVERCLKFNKKAKIYVCGCASQNDAEQFVSKNNVEYVIGTANKMSLVDSLDKSGMFVDNIPLKYEDDFSPIVDRTRGYVKIQDGCNNFCSYCLIPYVRGRSRSREIMSVVEECTQLSKTTKEIVLTGIDISSYGKEINSSMVELIKALKDVNCRIRLGSLEVSVITSQLLDATKLLKDFCPQFHLSLQSGEDSVLKKMNRHYTTKEYYNRVELIRRYYPYAGITTDLICAFPTETEENFLTTLDFIKQVGFSQVHVFPYSKRQGTVAAKMKMINGDIAKDRVHRAEAVAAVTRHDYLNSLLGKTLEVLIEDEEDGYMVGYSKEYVKVMVKNAVENTIVTVVAKSINKENIIGE